MTRYRAHMPLRTLSALVIAGVLLLTGCATGSPTASAPTTTASSTPTPTATPTPTPTPTQSDRLIVSVDAITLERDGAEEVHPLADGTAIVGLFAAVTGEPVAGEEYDGPYGSEGGVRYTWDGVTVSVDAYDGSAWVMFDGTSVGDVPITTPEGIGVESTRVQALAAGALDRCTYDSDGDGQSDALAIQLVEVADTKSLCREESTGVMFVELGFTGDTVSSIRVPMNDFSDI
jgi:hypothetical protein